MSGSSHRRDRRVLGAFWAVILGISATLIGLGDWFLKLKIFGITPQAFFLVGACLMLSVKLTVLLSQNFLPMTAPLRSFARWFVSQPRWFRFALVSYLMALTQIIITSSRIFSDLTLLQPILISSLFGLVGVVYAWNSFDKSALNIIAIAGLIASALIVLEAGLGASFFGSRHHSLYLLLPMVVISAMDVPNWLRLVGTLMILNAIIVTNSRMTTIVAILVLTAVGLMRFRATPISGLLYPAWAFAVFSAWALFDGALFNRFVSEPGDRMATINPGGLTPVTLNSNGRWEQWTLLFEQAIAHNWLVGGGTGFSREILQRNSDWTHPLNEYLRVFADYGVAGLLIVFLVLGSLVWGILKGCEALSDRILGVGTVITLSMTAMTDLPWVTLGVVLPASLILAKVLKGAIAQTRIVGFETP